MPEEGEKEGQEGPTLPPTWRSKPHWGLRETAKGVGTRRASARLGDEAGNARNWLVVDTTSEHRTPMRPRGPLFLRVTAGAGRAPSWRASFWQEGRRTTIAPTLHELVTIYPPSSSVDVCVLTGLVLHNLVTAL